MKLRIALYVAFVALAAPFEIILNWFVGYYRPSAQLWVRPVAEGLLYIYALTLVMETLFRLQQHPSVVRRKPWLAWFHFVGIGMIIFFMIDYMGVMWPYLSEGQKAPDSSIRQIAFMTVALAGSVVSYIAIERKKIPAAK